MAEENAGKKEPQGPMLFAPGQAPEANPPAPEKTEQDAPSITLPSPPRLPGTTQEPKAQPIPKKGAETSTAPIPEPEKKSLKQKADENTPELEKLRDEAGKLIRVEAYVDAAREVSMLLQANTAELNASRAKKAPIDDDLENPYIDVTDSKKALALSFKKYGELVESALDHDTPAAAQIDAINGMEKEELQKWIATKKEVLSPRLAEKGLSPEIMTEDFPIKSKDGKVELIDKADAAAELLIKKEVIKLALENEYTQEDKGALSKRLSAIDAMMLRIDPPARGKFTSIIPENIKSAAAAGAFAHPDYPAGAFSSIEDKPIPAEKAPATKSSHDPHAIPMHRYKDGGDLLHRKATTDDEVPSPIRDLLRRKIPTQEHPKDAKAEDKNGFGMLPEAFKKVVAQFMEESKTPLDSEHNTMASAKPPSKNEPHRG